MLLYIKKGFLLCSFHHVKIVFYGNLWEKSEGWRPQHTGWLEAQLIYCLKSLPMDY